MSHAIKAGLGVVTAATALAPVPYLSEAFHILAEINSLIQHVKGIRSRMKNLVLSLDILIRELERKLRSCHSILPDTRKGINDLEDLLHDVRASARDFAARNFFALALMRSDAHSIIQGYHGKVIATATALNIDLHLANQGLILKHEDARALDHQEILVHMKTLEKGQEKILEELHDAHRSTSSTIDPSELLEKLRDSEEHHPERELLGELIHAAPPAYPVVSFPQPDVSVPIEDAADSVFSMPTPFVDGKIAAIKPTQAIYISPLVTEPTNMMDGESIVPEKIDANDESGSEMSEGQALPTPPPTYGSYSSTSTRVTHDFGFVRDALQAWEWNAPESKTMDSTIHIPVAQIIY